MNPLHFALFGTPIGSCALVCGEHGLVRIFLPEADEAPRPGASPRAFRRRTTHDTRPSAELQITMARIDGLLAGVHDNLTGVALDMTGVPAFHRRVYDIIRSSPPCSTLTCGEVATRLGEPHAARAVGQALGANPFLIIVPCHHVLAAGDGVDGPSADGGLRSKLRLLQIEGTPLRGIPGLFDEISA